MCIATRDDAEPGRLKAMSGDRGGRKMATRTPALLTNHVSHMPLDASRPPQFARRILSVTTRATSDIAQLLSWHQQRVQISRSFTHVGHVTLPTSPAAWRRVRSACGSFNHIQHEHPIKRNLVNTLHIYPLSTQVYNLHCLGMSSVSVFHTNPAYITSARFLVCMRQPEKYAEERTIARSQSVQLSTRRTTRDAILHYQAGPASLRKPQFYHPFANRPRTPASGRHRT